MMDNQFQAQYTALKILRQRCEYLQQRVESLEEENCQLRLQKLEVNENRSKTSDNSLEKEVILLNKQNIKMTHQIQMISAENQNLWSQLSKLISATDNFSNTLSFSGVTEPSKDLKIGDIAKIRQLDSIDDCNKESLEEISLKLINGILMGKNELESQYSQMIDLQKENNTQQNNNFSTLPPQFDKRSTMNIMKVYIEKLKNFKERLYQQKTDLTNAIKHVKNLPKNFPKKIYNVIDSHTIDSASNKTTDSANNVIKNNERINSENDVRSDHICPMCGAFFFGEFKTFYQHVNDHFEDGNDDFASATFDLE